MKREILFRVWDTIEKCYLPEDVYCILNTTEFRAFGQMIKDWRDYREGEYFYDDSQILEQFTGLTDKNGVKIFEGDVIRYIEHNGYLLNSFAAIVCYDSLLAAFGYINNTQFMYYFSDFDEIDVDFLSHTEVIGNIHDNPELLK